MGHDSRTTLQYASGSTIRSRPTRHSLLAGLAWAVVAVEVVFRGSLLAYARYRSPTYPMERFYRNVGNPDELLSIDRAIFATGILLAVLALVWPNRKRWVAWAALLVHLYLLAVVGAFPATSRY